MRRPTVRPASRPVVLVLCKLAAWSIALTASPDLNGSRLVAGERDSSVAPRLLTRAVADLVAADIPLAAALSTPCALEKLPGSLAKLLPLIPSDHRVLIQECARGRVRLKRGVSAFDLVATIEDPVDRPPAVATVRAFFDERAVDIAVGRGLSDDPYPISFDWTVVLDPRSKTLFSFVLNCQD